MSMKYAVPKSSETVSVEGVQYEAHDGVVELPDSLSPATIGHLEKWHGITAITEPEAAPEGAGKGKK
jgi:hypothetical protein